MKALRWFAVISCVVLLIAGSGRVVKAQTKDSTVRMSPQDSVRGFDTIYQQRRAWLDRWKKEAHNTPHPQDDFLSIYANVGTYLKIRAMDLNEIFSERTLRADPSSDRVNLSTVDRAFTIGGQAQLARTWGIYVEYDYMGRDYSTVVDSSSLGRTPTDENLTLTTHSFVTGGMVILINSRFYRLRVNGGIGAVYAKTLEEESATHLTRAATALGYQFNVDLNNDFRVADWGSFTLDLLSRSMSTSVLKTADGKTLDEPFGIRKSPFTVAPRASNLTFGLTIGLVYYF